MFVGVSQALPILSLLCVPRKRLALTHAVDAHRLQYLLQRRHRCISRNHSASTASNNSTSSQQYTMSGWAAKQAKKAEWAEARKLDGLDSKESTVNDTRDAAMGKGEDQLFEKKLSKEEQKAEKERKKARRCVELDQ